MMKQGLDFSKKKDNKRRKTAAAIIFTVSGVLLLGIISFVVILAMNDFDITKFLGTRLPAAEETTLGATESTSALPEDETDSVDSGVVNILILCADNKNITFCELVSANPSANTVKVKPISPDMKLTCNSSEMTAGELYSAYTAAKLCEALNGCNIKIDRYIEMTETSFKLIMKKFGPVDIYLENDLTYTVESIKYSLSAGRQTMSADVLLKYMKYVAEGSELLKYQSEAVATVIRTYFTAANVEKGEAFFSELVNLVNGNITAFDYNGAYSVMLAFAGKQPLVSAIP